MKIKGAKVHGKVYHKATGLELRVAERLYPEWKLKARNSPGIARNLCSILSGVALAQSFIFRDQPWAPLLLGAGVVLTFITFYSIRLKRVALENRVDLLELELARLHLETERAIIEECEDEGEDPAPYLEEYRKSHGLLNDYERGK